MLTEILRLSGRQLEQLRGALSDGSIAPGAGAAQVRKAGIDDPDLVRAWLAEAAESFGSNAGLIAAIRLLQADRARSEPAHSHTELILSGPGADDTPSRDTRVVVRELFESVRRSVLIVGYAFHGSDRIFEPLACRMGADPSLSARLIVNVHPDDRRSPEQTVREYAAAFTRMCWPFFPRPALYYLPGSLESRADRRSSVHAKMIVADQEAVYLGSANFTTAAFERNIEAGLRLRSATLGLALTGHFDRMIRRGLVVPLPLG